MAAHGGDQFDRREGGVSDDDDQPVRQPALDLENALAGPVCERLVTFALGVIVALRGGQYRQERQGPAPVAEGQWDHGHEGKPAQAARLDEMAVRGAHRIAVDAARRDLLAPAPLDGVVDADDDRPVRQETFEDYHQQLAGNGPAVPARLAEHMM